MPTDFTHDPDLRSWVESANDPACDFPIQNLPVCSFVHRGGPSIGVAIGDSLLSLSDLVSEGLLDDAIGDGPGADDRRMALGAGLLDILFESFTPRDLTRLRGVLSRLLSTDARLRDDPALRTRAFAPLAGAEFQAPRFPNYTDFYASIHHASTVGAMFRPDNPLLPNYKHVPIGYHGRASSIVASGTGIRRPAGQTKADDAPAPTFGPCRMLDYELEVGCIVGPGNALGEPIPVSRAREHILGLCLVNDWSARDIQKWEYQPLGPFLAKNFATTVSPFVVTLGALEPFRCPAYPRPAGDPQPLDYLRDASDQAAGGFDITLEVHLRSAEMEKRGLPSVRISHGRAFRDMYWTFPQMIAHHTSNGCDLQSGDLIASGTVSGTTPESRGCLLELTWDGTDPVTGRPRPRKPIQLPTGESRTFLADGDTVIIKGYCERDGFRRIGFGECRGTIRPTA